MVRDEALPFKELESFAIAIVDPVIETIAQKVVAETFDMPELNADTQFEQLASARLTELGVGNDRAPKVFSGSLANTAKIARERVRAVRSGHD